MEGDVYWRRRLALVVLIFHLWHVYFVAKINLTNQYVVKQKDHKVISVKVLFGFGTLSDFGKGHNGEVLFGLFGLWKEISKVYFGDKQSMLFMFLS